MKRLARRISLLVILWCFFFPASAQLTAGFSIVVPSSNCNPAIYSFVNTSVGVGLTYKWNFGVYPGINSIFQNPSTTYLNCGTFPVKLIITDTTGRKDSIVQMVTVRCSPTATFNTTSTTGCLPLVANFNSTSVAGSGNIVNYIWDFGDGNSGAGANPGHTYLVAGCKNVTLIVTNSYNCTTDTTINNLLCAYPSPVSSFTSGTHNACNGPLSVSYQATSAGSAAPYTYSWLFPGGVPSSSSLANPTIIYNTAGSFNTTLVTADAHGCSDTVISNNYVTIGRDTVDFALSNALRCAPANIAVAGSSGGTPLVWQWTVNSPATIANASAKNTSISFPTAGSYNICLTATYVGGCTAQKCSTIVINSNPVANFGASGPLNTCSVPTTITYLDSSTGSNLSYYWILPGIFPAFSSVQSPTVTYNRCGNFTVSLKVTDDVGCTSSISKTDFLKVSCIRPSYTVTPSNGCLPLTAYFNGTSNGHPVSWLWNFDDPISGANNTSTLQNPTHTYTVDGCHTITLTVVDSLGCTVTYSYPAGVCAGWRPHANFSANPPQNCANLPIFFTDSSTNTYAYTQYVWDFHGRNPVVVQDTLQNPSYIYGSSGIWDITLIVSNYGCADTITIDNLVQTFDPVSVPHVIRNCRNPLTVTLDGTASHGADHYKWYIIGGTPDTALTPIVSATFPAPGDYNVALYVTNDSTGCSDLENVIVHITSVGAQFSGAPLKGCAPMQSCMSSTALNAVNYEWKVFDSNGALDTMTTAKSPCFNFRNAGIYSVQLIVADTFGCIDTMYKPDYIKVSHPVANVTANPLIGCAPLSVDFFDASTGAVAGISKWQWNFGDSLSGMLDSSRLQNPSHIYSRVGDYSIKLHIVDSLGCVSDTLKFHYIHTSNPDAGFVAIDSISCGSKQTCFTLNVNDPSVSYHWDFGDSTTASVGNVCHSYTASGIYNVVVTATDTVGCIATSTIIDSVKVLNINLGFVADTTVTSCPPLLVSFTNNSTGADSTVLWHWDFGDGQVSALSNPFHIYSSAGKFTVSLLSTSPSGCHDTLSFPEYINITGPTAFVSTAPTSGCVPHATCMSATSAFATSFTWNFGDGMVTAGSDSICYTYTRSGTFYPELILSNGNGCVFSLPMGRVDVGGSVAKFSADRTGICQQGVVTFTDSSFGTSLPANWNWDFGDPSSGSQNYSTQQNPSHYFASPGTYHIVEHIVSTDGCMDSASTTVTIYTSLVPSIALSDSSVCGAHTISFQGLLNGGNATVHTWDFGDTSSGLANTSALLNASHYYSLPGQYTITLNVADSNGCSGTSQALVTIHSKPLASFTIGDTCLNTQPIMLADQSQNTNSWLWQFGDGTSSQQNNPTHTFADSGLYSVQLIVRNAYCSDSIIKQVHIFGVPSAAFDLSSASLCGTPAHFELTNQSIGAVTYGWNFDNGNTSKDISPAAIFDSAGQYQIMLTAISEHQCIDTASKTITVFNAPTIQRIDIGPSEGCQPLTVNIRADVTNADNIIWDIGMPTNSAQNSQNIIVTYQDTGTYSITLYATSIHQCADTMVLHDTVKVHSVPVADFDTLINSSVYPYDGMVAFINHSQNATNYYWDFGDGNSSTQFSPSHRYERVDAFDVSLVSTTDYGCADTAYKAVHVIKKSLYVPNALQPGFNDGDELVKVWKPLGIGLLRYHAQVFNQWGELLWQSEALTATQPSEGWDGTYQGKPCPADVYVWKIDAVFVDGSIWPGMIYSADEGGGTKTVGSITLVR